MTAVKLLVCLLFLAVLGATRDLPSPVSRYYFDDDSRVDLYGNALVTDGGIKLDGSDGSYAHVVSDMSPNATSLSISTWVRWISGQGNVLTMNEALYIESVSGIGYRLRFGTPSADEDEIYFPLMTLDKCLGWTHVAVTNQDGWLQMYMNGSRYGPLMNRTQVEMNMPATIAIGSGDGLHMEMEELSIFDQKLTASDVSQLYHSGFSGQYFTIYVLDGTESCYLDYGWVSATGEDFGRYGPHDEYNLVWICDEISHERIWQVKRQEAIEDVTCTVQAYWNGQFCIAENDGDFGEGFEVLNEQYNLKCDRSDGAPYEWQLDWRGGIAYHVSRTDEDSCVWTRSDNRRQYTKNGLQKYGYEAVCDSRQDSISPSLLFFDALDDTSEEERIYEKPIPGVPFLIDEKDMYVNVTIHKYASLLDGLDVRECSILWGDDNELKNTSYVDVWKDSTLAQDIHVNGPLISLRYVQQQSLPDSCSFGALIVTRIEDFGEEEDFVRAYVRAAALWEYISLLNYQLTKC